MSANCHGGSVPDLELLEHEDGNDNKSAVCISGNEGKEVVTDDQQIQLSEDDDCDHTDDGEKEESDGVNDDVDDEEKDDDEETSVDEDEETSVDEDEETSVDEDEEKDDNEETSGGEDEEQELKTTKSKKRKFIDYNGELNAANTSLMALESLAGSKKEHKSSDLTDGILSNEDFKRIKELKAKKEAKLRLLRKGSETKSTAFKIPSSDQLSAKRVDPSQLEVHIRKKMSKEERLALVRAGREDRGKYRASTAVKQKKIEKGPGGLSNRQKEHKKLMPLAAKKAKISRSRQEKKIKKQRSGKQFRGKKAWK